MLRHFVTYCANFSLHKSQILFERPPYNYVVVFNSLGQTSEKRVLLIVNNFMSFVLFRPISCLGHRKSIRSHGSVHLHHPLGHLRRNLSRVEVGARQLPLRPLRPRRLGLPGQDHVQPRQRGEGGVRQVCKGLIFIASGRISGCRRVFVFLVGRR